MNIQGSVKYFGKSTFLGIVLLFNGISLGQAPAAFNPVVPKTWDDAAIAALEVPLADPIGSPKHVSSAYYYKIPVRQIYKQYPVYAPGREPAGYMEWLKKQEPVILLRATQTINRN